MEMVDMDIGNFWFLGPKSRSVNIFSASESWIGFDVGFVDFAKMTFLEIVHMYLMVFDMTNLFVVRFSQYLIKIHQY